MSSLKKVKNIRQYVFSGRTGIRPSDKGLQDNISFMQIVV
jgi:hypothetical protein